MSNDQINTTLSRAVCACSIRTKPSIVLQTTCDEKQFRNYLQQPKTKHMQKTSSPIDLSSFILSSLHTDKTESQSCQTDIQSEVKGERDVCKGRRDWPLEKTSHLLLFLPRTREASWRDRLPTGQENSVLRLPGLQEALWVHTAKHPRQDHRGKRRHRGVTCHLILFFKKTYLFTSKFLKKKSNSDKRVKMKTKGSGLFRIVLQEFIR